MKLRLLTKQEINKLLEKVLLIFVVILMTTLQVQGVVFAENPCPSGMSNLDCQALNNDWTQWVPNVCSAGAASVTLSGSDGQQKAFNFFVGQGLGAIQAAAIIGNMEQESGLNPERIQNGYGGGKKISTNPSDADPGGWGIVQWTPGSKATTIYQQYSSSQVAPFIQVSGNIYDLATQLEMVWDEMNGVSPTGVQNMVSGFNQQLTLSAAVNYFLKDFEGGTPGSRLTYAQQILQLYGSSTPSNNVPGDQATLTNCSGSGGGSSVVGCNFGVGSGQFTTSNNPVSVGPQEISVTQMCSRVQQLVYDRSGSVFSQFLAGCSSSGPACPDSWCALSTAVAWGYKTAGYNAIDLWNHLNSEGYGHAGDTSPPVGALLFYHSVSSYGHVTVYLGNNLVMSTDISGPGVIGEDPGGQHIGYIWIAPESTVEKWVSAPAPYTNDPYIGWAEPIFNTTQVP